MHERTRKDLIEYYHSSHNNRAMVVEGDDGFSRLASMINAAGRAAEKAVLDAWIQAETRGE